MVLHGTVPRNVRSYCSASVSSDRSPSRITFTILTPKNMQPDNSTYDDLAELTEYLWHNYVVLFSENERLTARTLLSEEKMASRQMSEPMRHLMRRKLVSRGNPDIDQLLANGPHAFRVSAALRVMEVSKDEYFVNRCPLCSRIVATPRAKQCLWCGHDWHVKHDT